MKRIEEIIKRWQITEMESDNEVAVLQKQIEME